MVAGGLRGGLGDTGRPRGICLSIDPGAPDGTPISLAVRAQRLAGLGAAALKLFQRSTSWRSTRETCMSRIWGTLAIAAIALGATQASAQIKIATVGPMTGANAAFGEQMKHGADIAGGDINAAGGVN